MRSCFLFFIFFFIVFFFSFSFSSFLYIPFLLAPIVDKKFDNIMVFIGFVRVELTLEPVCKLEVAIVTVAQRSYTLSCSFIISLSVMQIATHGWDRHLSCKGFR
ncbi:uncharacterized protein BO87DRAFT_99791 [Aspergillus neoniger CBS 115656]|uniref:Uncharacterized protein n=1 Tax=Aspergillus neoniger (strain CBS 115656) TaxID=1448310 RepID=A0A318YEH8_ASPNB|nr:hypothetical protein BO87DRAFT_99791 [Aspergillus neoniger CBS 115656]PYH32855.1 hypothetical protein BO87DRAFT_99791 [Aspergillus neoniger CBS 115656]